MATNRTRRSRNRRDNIVELTGPQRDSLLHGHDFFGGAFQSEDDRREAWKLHRAGLLAFWLQDPDEWLTAGNQNGFGNPAPGGPGTRPSAWWMYDMPNEPLTTISPAEQIALETEKRGEAVYTGDSEHPQSYFYNDEQETSVEYLRRLKLLTKDETAYLKRLSKDVTDWDFLQRNGWLTAGGRRRWFLGCRSYTAKGIASARLDLQYLARLNLSPVVTRDDMGKDHSTLWQMADMVIIQD
jgi:hypothetical protein